MDELQTIGEQMERLIERKRKLEHLQFAKAVQDEVAQRGYALREGDQPVEGLQQLPLKRFMTTIVDEEEQFAPSVKSDAPTQQEWMSKLSPPPLTEDSRYEEPRDPRWRKCGRMKESHDAFVRYSLYYPTPACRDGVPVTLVTPHGRVMQVAFCKTLKGAVLVKP
jgi:hypothetical protein